MQKTTVENTSPEGDVDRPVICPHCQGANVDWTIYCAHCGRELPEPEQAMHAELGHIGYLLNQVENLKRRNVLSVAISAWINSEFVQRRAMLRAGLEARKSQSLSPPIVPAMPSGFPALVMGHAGPLPAPSRVHAWVQKMGTDLAAPAPYELEAPLAPPSVEKRPLLQEHGLKVMFALAVALLLIGLRGVLAWDSQIAAHLVPALPLALTIMFRMFGRKTRAENPWAACVYDGLAALMLGADVIAANRYWLHPLGAALDIRATLLLAASATTLALGALLYRYREIPYLHLCLGGALTTLFCGLQVVRHLLLGGNDFRTTPLLLFAIAYLLVAAIALAVARNYRTMAVMAIQEATEEGQNRGEHSKAWGAAWTLWVHLAMTAVLLFAASEWVQARSHSLESFALIALLAGGLYACAAQGLEEARHVYLSTLFLLGGGVLHLVSAGQTAGDYFGGMLLGGSAFALAFAIYNGRRVQTATAASELTKAWGRVSLSGVWLATTLVWIDLLRSLIPGAGIASVQEWGRGALLALGCAGFFLLFVRREKRLEYVYGVLTSIAIALVYAAGIAGKPIHFMPGDGLASVALVFALLGVGGTIYRKGRTAPDAVDLWSEPAMRVAVGLACVAVIEWMILWLENQPSVYSEWVLLPGIVALLVAPAGRRSAGVDVLGLSIYGVLYATLIPEMVALTGGTHGLAHWTADQRQGCGVGLLALAWCGWTVGFLRSRDAKTTQGTGISEGALVTGVFSALAAVSAVMLHSRVSEPATWVGMGVVAGVGALALLDAALRKRQAALPLALFALALEAGISLYAYTAYPLPVALAWSILTLASTANLLWLGRRLESTAPPCMGLCAFFGGYALLAALRYEDPLSHQNGLLLDGIWIGAGALITGALLRTAAWSKETTFSYAAGLTAVGAYLRLVHLLFHPSAEGIALALLPMLVLLFGVGERTPEAEAPFISRPLRQMAGLLSLCALIGSIVSGLGSAMQSHDRLGTLTLAAYGGVYGLLACYRKTLLFVSLAAVTLTAAYLHALQVFTALLGYHTALSSPHLSFLAIQAGVFWVAVSWGVGRRAAWATLAPPLQATSAAVVLCSALAAVFTVQTPGAGIWSILTLAWAGGIWFALWGMERGEVCLHVGTWNLLAAWGLVLYNQVGSDTRMLDLYLLPVGLYLMAVGHRTSRGRKSVLAQWFWGSGLLLTMTPPFLDYWHHVAGWHTVLFLAECAVFVLWGIGQRIRVFVSAGLGYLLLFAASVFVGNLPDIGGTLAALLGGIVLFIAGFYALTHKEAAQRALMRLNAQWHVWQSWR